MKNILRKFHKGSNHDHHPDRTTEVPPTSSSPPPSFISDHHIGAAAVEAETSPPSPSPAPSTAAAERNNDYLSSEEEYQIQLAMAISASKADLRDDPDSDHIRAATLLSLGTHRNVLAGEEEGAAESLSRRYWDYNVVDYDEKVVDGFYDIYGLSYSTASHGKIPSLMDLQTSIGDLGFEVIIVNRVIDNSLLELEQIAHCICLDIPTAEIAFMVQRISELVAQHLGGAVKDAHDMLARWMEKSSELRTSLQTSLLPIGCIKIGLSRHRSLLFKVLADKVGIPCRLVKGSHYTGIDDDAVNIIKLGDGREFLVDLMAAPGTLLPADVLNAKDVPLDCRNANVNQNLLLWKENDSDNDLLTIEPSFGKLKGGSGTSTLDYNGVLDKESRYGRPLILSKFPSAPDGASSTNVGSSYDSNAKDMFPDGQMNQFSSTMTATSSKLTEASASGTESLVNQMPNMVPRTEGTTDSRDLFEELNPFRAVGSVKPSAQFKAAGNKNMEYQKHRENNAPGPGRPLLPLVVKNRSPCNVIPNTKQNNYADGQIPRNHVGAENHNISSSYSSSSAGKRCSESQNVISSVSGSSCSAEASTSGNKVLHTETGAVSSLDARTNSQGEVNTTHITATASKQLIPVQSGGNNVWENRMMHDPKEHGKIINGRRSRKKDIHDRFMGMNMISDDQDSSSSSQTRPSNLDPMLDDVAEWEIPWDHLVIGERIGLGSYGEVYRADWNGTEVAVKKFLDQDFYGDALDEFRSEVRIMRRLRHPNVVLFLGAVTRPPNLSIVSEFLPRGSLYRILHRSNCQIDETRRIKMALDVAKGMNCLHTSTPTVVHRDLKSPNLLVDKNWTVKVCDFGLSRLKHSTFLSSKSTAGTPEWMAPEVLRNEQSNEKCDVYSFGVILWELATLRMPWRGMNPMQVVGAVGFQDRRLDIPKEVDPLVATIIWECWQKEPSLRPSFAQLTTALKSLQRLVIPSHQESHSPTLSQEIPLHTNPKEFLKL